MIIDLTSIVARPKAIELNFLPDEIDLEIEGAKLAGDAKFKGETERVDGKAHVRGTINVGVLVDCTRCLVPVAKEFEISFDDIFIDPADEPDEIEVVLDPNALDESIAIDGKIDLAEIVREQIILALPDQVYCDDDCKGLCPECGSNRNLIDCRCIEDEIDPRWSALKGF
ncbi:MAG: DUF177 domain-containing protein [Pyrinomonadaceae bacterium]|nr:DUF177 domain-containing protein [Acidobacteriota bacterium]MBP7376639.1 DUF177 domain-containing protein [Pyrinomonadaceae bacterium]